MILPRRQVLTGAALIAGSMLIPRIAAAATGRDRRLVVVMLRGGMDGLAAIEPHGDPAFAALRPPINPATMPAGATIAPTLPLDGFYRAHGALKTLAAMFASKQAIIFHAIASPYRGRSHFDAQEVLESGLTREAMGADSGWLNRALAAIPMQPGERADAVAVAATTPLLLRGAAPVESWQPQVLPYADPDLCERLLALYSARDPALAQALQNGIGVDAFLSATDDPQKMGRKGPADSPAGFPAAMQSLAALMTRANGPRIAMLNYDGWDTHAMEIGRLNGQLAALDAGLANLRQGLGPVWNDSAVLFITEFGRTARINGTRGTDHGTGGVAFLVGGAVNGGRVVADWPGVTDAALLQGRDLRPTTDIRAVAKGIFTDAFGLDRQRLDGSVFPDSAAIAPMRGLIRA